jgi:hypothetical protein
MQVDTFVSKWAASGAAERANKDSFLNDLCDALGYRFDLYASFDGSGQHRPEGTCWQAVQKSAG